jgi:UDP-glucose 4-epimerase
MPTDECGVVLNGKGMNVVVTGGGGFIGSHLVERLLRDGHRVDVLDNFSTGRAENLKGVVGSERLRIHYVDVAEFKSIEPLFEGADWCFHLAALADIVPSIQRPLEYFKANVQGTANVVQAARAAGVRRLVYGASSSCYGIPDIYPTPETAEIRPQYPYALTKFLGEQLVLHWAHVYGQAAVALRFFNVFGPRARTSGTYGAVFGVFLAQKLAGRPFTVVGDGSQTRDFTFVTDVVGALCAAAASDISGVVLNVGSGATYSINYLVSLLGGEVENIPKRPGEPDCTYADTTRIQQMLGWRPRVSFEEGVCTMLRGIEYWKEAPVWTPSTINVATREWFEHLEKQKSANSLSRRL